MTTMALFNANSMHQLHKDVLLCLHGELVREMRMTDKFLTNLEEKRVLSLSMRQRIEAKGSADDADDQTREFLTILPKRGPDVFWRTLRCLELSGQHAVAATLREEQAKRVPCPASPYLPYPVKSGRILIINVYNVRNQEQRDGSEVDINNLQETFALFGYHPQVEQDEHRKPMTRKRMLDAIVSFADVCRIAEVDACVLALMTHGDAYDKLMSSDGKTVSLADVQAPLEKSIYLRSKPKMLIVQACRGGEEDTPSMDDVDPGATVGDLLPVGLQRFERTDIQVEAPEVSAEDNNRAAGGRLSSARAPRGADFVVTRSSQPGYVSYRNAKNGSWFIEDLCSTVREMGDQTDVVGLLYIVLDKMSKRMAHKGGRSICPTTSTLNKPFFLSTLHKM